MGNNEQILKHCPHFYTIINFEFYSDDNISEKLIDVYQKYVFTINLNNKEEVKKLEKLDKLMYTYISDNAFRNQIKLDIRSIKVAKSGNILESIVNAIIGFFEKYEDIRISRVVLPRWI